MSSASLELKNTIVRAGAGAGKTTDLVRRVLDLEEKFLRIEKRHPKIVVTTFTRKATQELKERLLAKAIASGSQATIDFVQRASHLHISTIHGVLSIYLSRYGSALGLSPQFQILSQTAVNRRAKRVFRDILQTDRDFSSRAAQLLEVTDLDNLLQSLIQYSNLDALGRPKRITANDLTTILEDQLSIVIQKGKSLLEMMEGEELSEAWKNYETHLDGLLRSKDITIGHIQQFLETAKSPTKTKKISETLGDAKNEFQDFLKDFLSYNVTEDFLQLHEKYSLDFEIIAKNFSQGLLSQTIKTSQLSLSDLELMALRLMRDFPETAELFSEEWDYWMVDEYQDTSPLQVLLLNGLSGKKASFTVGDPQQSIYLFRGARSEVFLEKEKLLERENGECLRLMKNYRSQPELLNFFNDICTRLNPRQFQPMEVGFDKNLTCFEKDPVQIMVAQDASQEIYAVIERMQELIRLGIAPEKICVLSRGNKEIDLLAKEAKAVGIPIQVHASSQFAKRQEIRDAVALLRFLVNPSDNVSFLHCLRSPFHFVKDEDLQGLASEGDFYFAQALKKGWTSVLDLQNRIETCRRQGLISVWKTTLKECRYFDILQLEDSSGRKEANLWKLVSLISLAEKIPGFSILDFLDEMTNPQVESDGDQDATPVIEPAKINLMTVHASKGLQFEYVIVPFLGKRTPSPNAKFFLVDDEGAWTLSLPNPEDNRITKSLYGSSILESRKERESLELERLFYVALTRAEMGVTLVWSKSDKSSLAARLIELGFGGNQVHEGYSVCFRSQAWEQCKKIERVETNKKVIREAYSPQQSSSAQTVAVTEILSSAATAAGGEKSSEASLISLQKALLGVEVHRLFEGLKYQSTLTSKDPKIQTAVSYLKSLHQGKILELIQLGEVEWGFAIQKNQWLIQGQIDLWGKASDGQYYVVDYKTGSERYKDKAFEQLEIYSWALRRMGRIPEQIQPTLMIIYPFSAQVLERPAALFNTIDAALIRPLS